MASTTSRPETIDQARTRLAQRARESGVKLRVDVNTGRWYATSVSRPGLEHFVTAHSCTCEGFIRRQRCVHHSAVLAAIGWLPDAADDPDDTAA